MVGGRHGSIILSPGCIGHFYMRFSLIPPFPVGISGCSGVSGGLLVSLARDMVCPSPIYIYIEITDVYK